MKWWGKLFKRKKEIILGLASTFTDNGEGILSQSLFLGNIGNISHGSKVRTVDG